MYFRARKSTRIKTGKPQPSSKVPITIEDSPSIQGIESPPKATITYESGIPRSPTWKEKVELQDPKNNPTGGSDSSIGDTVETIGDPKFGEINGRTTIGKGGRNRATRT